MRDFGFGRRQEKLESEIMDEMTLFIDILKNGPIYDGEKVRPFLRNINIREYRSFVMKKIFFSQEIIKGNLALFPDVLFAPSANNIWNVMFGYRFDRSEHDISRHLSRSAIMMQKANDPTGGALFQRPFLKYFGNMFGYTNHIKGNYGMIEVVKVDFFVERIQLRVTVLI